LYGSSPDEFTGDVGPGTQVVDLPGLGTPPARTYCSFLRIQRDAIPTVRAGEGECHANNLAYRYLLSCDDLHAADRPLGW